MILKDHYQKTTKDLSWFFGDYIQTNKKSITRSKKQKLMVTAYKVTLKNKRNITALLHYTA